MIWKYTRLQGQYIAFIAMYTRVTGNPPAEADIRRYFKVTPAFAHEMVLGLENQGYIFRKAGHTRSIRVRVPRDRIPTLL